MPLTKKEINLDFKLIEFRVRQLMNFYGFRIQDIVINPQIIITNELPEMVNGYFRMDENPANDVIILREGCEYIEAVLAHEITHLLQPEKSSSMSDWYDAEAMIIEDHYRKYHLQQNPEFIDWVYKIDELVSDDHRREVRKLIDKYIGLSKEIRTKDFTEAMESVDKILKWI